jgi:uncharacterized membrane protein
MRSRAFAVLILVLSALVCGYDVYAALRSGGRNVVAWVLAALMAFVALSALRTLIRKDYSNSRW